MKRSIAVLLIFSSILGSAQNNCPFTTSETVEQGDLKQTILNGEDNVLNQLHIKTGIGPDGSMESRIYAPLIYSSNVWASGMDPNGSLKLAAGRYDLQDWWPGPLNDNGQTEDEQCDFWDQVFTYTKEDILEARDIFNSGAPCSNMPEAILNWPAKGNPFISDLYLDLNAEFYDNNLDGIYNPCDGDIPSISFQSCNSNNWENQYSNIPAHVSYYVMNDNGGDHILTQASAIQMEIGVYTFSYKSPGAENIIFNKYTLTNKATDDFREFRFVNWFDFDLGCYQNDFIGSDKESGMLFAYNAEDTDDCADLSLSSPLPMIGTSCLRGFAVGKNKEYDEDGNLILVDPPFNNFNPDTLVNTVVSNILIPNNCVGNDTMSLCRPIIDTEFYNTSAGYYLDGSPILDETGNQVDFMFEGNPSDPNSMALCNTDSKLIETTATMSIGSGLFVPGSKGEIITTTFVTHEAEYPCPDLAPLKYKQSIAQKLYDNCFFNYLTPPAPTLIANNSNAEIKLTLSSIPFGYKEQIPYYLVNDIDTYNFEGIKIYQVASRNFDLTELNNPAYSRLVYQGDITNDITDIANYKATFDGPDIDFIPENKVLGENNGIVSQVILDKDYLTDTPIESDKEYFYVAVSYAYNNYKDFDPENQSGQQYPYMESNCGIKVVSSDMTLSDSETLYSVKPYDFQFSNNRLILSKIQEDLNVHLITSDGKMIKQLFIAKGNDFESNAVFEHLPNGLYFIHVNATKSDLKRSHKIVVMN